MTVTAQANWHAKQRAAGLCRSCREQAFKGGLCQRHYRRSRFIASAYRRRRAVREFIETIRLVDGPG